MTAPTPTQMAYEEMQIAYTHYNLGLFEGKLPDCLITFHRSKPNTFGYFSSNRFVRLDKSGTTTDEIAMNPIHFARRSVRETMSTLVHEMTHLWQQHHGNPSRAAYHNREWGVKMREVGLHPSNTGAAGGKETGQRMSHYIIEGGPFDKVTALLAIGLSWGDAATMSLVAKPVGKSGKRTKYSCPDCGTNAWAASEVRIICGDCKEPMEPV